MTASSVFLQTDRLRLRRVNPADAELFFLLDSDPEVMRHISKGKPTPLSKIRDSIIPGLLEYYEQPGHQGFWTAELLPGDEFVGWFHLRADKLEPDEMELGYRLRREFWGKGLATEGSAALLRKGFLELDYLKICARTLQGNLASQRVMQKVGLRLESHFTYPLEVIPDWSEADRAAVKYSLTATDYRSGASANPSVG